MCYSYLFHKSAHLRPNFDKRNPKLLHNLTTDIQEVLPDIHDDQSVSEICSFLDKTNCERWKDCCSAAVSCCERQLNAFPTTDLKCPMTWDGFGCVDSTDPGTNSIIECPDFIEYGFSSGYARKSCTENGTWWVDSKSNREWTDYTPCLNLKIYKSLVYVGIACSSASLVLLVPACVVFLSLRQLRSQHRIRLHTCLFLSFIMTCIVTILSDLLIYNDRLDNPASTRMHQNTIFCRVLHAVHRYCSTCNYFWMFCEGFYLHRLLIQAFRVPKNLTWYYITGWGGSLIPILVYVIVRLTTADYDCWVKNIGIYEWILYIPNLICILLNLMFLCSIIRIMLTRLQSHPNEPSNYRRGLKATFLLVPLFGIQLFFITYRPPVEKANRLLYEIVSKVIIDSQGSLVSLIFFYMNAEVHTALKYQLRIIHLQFPYKTKKSISRNQSATQMSSIRQTSQRNGCYDGPKFEKTVHINGDAKEYVFS
ncbi:calcitonin gene-related peptide type 1 receptor-like [Mytilus galloprovincialis]|uniref:calcitonin gene-related peptide type 1 receptor-like n=1 Tax=Mytilus galloprovincialis TaxID=29158 RepID=UPI003F7B362B